MGDGSCTRKHISVCDNTHQLQARICDATCWVVQANEVCLDLCWEWVVLYCEVQCQCILWPRGDSHHGNAGSGR